MKSRKEPVQTPKRSARRGIIKSQKSVMWRAIAPGKSTRNVPALWLSGRPHHGNDVPGRERGPRGEEKAWRGSKPSPLTIAWCKSSLRPGRCRNPWGAKRQKCIPIGEACAVLRWQTDASSTSRKEIMVASKSIVFNGDKCK
jgi:hypothetical protein